MSKSVIPWDEFEGKIPDSKFNEKDNKKWLESVQKISEKIIVLDDDPTGVQTVNSIPVYTSWDRKTLKKIMFEEYKVVYILTNSRSLKTKETQKLHQQIAANLVEISEQNNQDFIIISRSDSTLRGHYPLETEVLHDELRKKSNIDGEIIIPFFLEGGRYTFNDIHFVKEGDKLIPAAQTEFAKDVDFGYNSSDLKSWVEEKTSGEYSSDKVLSITIDMLRNKKIDKIEEILLTVSDFNKVIVNACDYSDLKIFLIALSNVLQNGKKYIFRTAASFVQVIGGIKPIPLLGKNELYAKRGFVGPGLVVIGSYVQKTTQQFNELSKLTDLECIEFQVKQTVTVEKWKKEINRVIEKINESFKKDKDVCLYTTREFFNIKEEFDSDEDNLLFLRRISEGLVKIVKNINKVPGYLVSKGGITSSDIGVKALKVKRAMVLGQIKPGIPVWRLGDESVYPGLPYVIFPGNVGNKETLKEVIQILRD